MFMLGTHIIEKYSGIPYAAFVSKRILVPLGMVDTTYHPAAALKTGRLSKSWTSFGRLIPMWLGDDSSARLMAGAGSLISSTSDLSIWLRTLLIAYSSESREVCGIPTQALRYPMQRHVSIKCFAPPPFPGIDSYGHGWTQTNSHGRKVGPPSTSAPPIHRR